MDQHVGIDPTLVCEKGDVNNDGHINLADVVAGATFVQGQSVEGYVRQSADMNDDGKVARMRAGEEGVLKLSCNSSVTSVGALQFDITLPEGVELEEVTRTSNLMSIYNVIMRPLAGNSYRVIVYSAYLRNMPATVDILELKVKPSADMASGSYGITLSNAFGSQLDAKVVLSADVQTPVSVLPPVGIHSVRPDATNPDGDTYDLQGRRARQNQRGIYITDGKKEKR